MRSRVTAKDWPTSSSVCSLPSSRPKRILITFSSRGVSVFNTEDVCSFKLRLMTASDGETTALSSMKSPRCESSSSPMGVSREIGSCAIFKILRTLDTGMSMRLAISSLVGSRPSSCTNWRLGRTRLFIVSLLCTGVRMGGARARRARGDGASDGLANPPGGVGRKFVAAAPLEFIDGLHQADVALLDQVQELQAAIGIFFRDGNDQAQVGFDQFLFGLFGFGFAAMNDGERALE